MITRYERPQNLEDALRLLAEPDTRALGGGTVLTHLTSPDFAVVDLQALGLDKLKKSGNTLNVGASVTLSQLLDSPYLPDGLTKAIRMEAPLNLRNVASLAGSLVTCDGRSPLAVVLLSLDAKLTLLPGEKKFSLGDLLPVREKQLKGKLISQVEFPLNITLAFETVARTPADRPILCTALARWPSGRTRLAIGGFGPVPLLAMDGNEAGGLEAAARNACVDSGDEWASAEYRSEVAPVLAKRCLDSAG